ncbi:MAG: hypothetical protein IJX23_01195 [Clostridia bacterium]|nr:hypothetical protein [Clostridia bacterium]
MMTKKFNKELFAKIAYFVGAFAVVVGALLFVLLTDFLLKLGAAWMFVTIVLALGACVCQVLSDTYRDRRKTAIILKAVAIFLCVLLIAFMFIYMMTAFNGMDNPDNIFYIKKYTKSNKSICTVVVIVTVVFSVLSIAGLTFDLVKTITSKDE